MWKIVDKVHIIGQYARANCDNVVCNPMRLLELRAELVADNHTTTISFVALPSAGRTPDMPELPEVEFAAKRLRDAVLGQRLKRVSTHHPSLARNFPAAHAKLLTGRTLVAVDRRAKIQLLTFDDGQILEVHFRMNGDWAFTRGNAAAPRYQRMRLSFANRIHVSLVDSRALAVVVRHAPGALMLPELGPEPLTDALTSEWLLTALASRRAPVKQVLLDQRVVAGIGNIYASEALWEARISPMTPAQTLSKARIVRLIDAIRVVLLRAQGERYHAPVDPDIEPNEFRVYDRENEPCLRHHGGHIRRIVQGGRGTYYCPRCQR